MMTKSLRRVLDQVRAAIDGTFRNPTAARDGVQDPQRMHSRG
jgi:hypothetical protein